MARPLKYKTPDKLQKAVDKYFKNEDKPTICGLALALGFSSRQSLLDYGEKAEFVDIIKSAKTYLESLVEKRVLYENCGAGPIFWLKANRGWKEIQHHEHTGSIEQVIREVEGTS